MGEMPIGYCVARLHARTSYLESAPVQFVTEPAALGQVNDEQLAYWARQR